MAKRSATEEAGGLPKRRMAIEYLLENSDDETTPLDVAAGPADIPTMSSSPSIQQAQAHDATGSFDYIQHLGKILYEAAERVDLDLELETTSDTEELATDHTVSTSATRHQVITLASVVSSTAVSVPPATAQEVATPNPQPKIIRLKGPKRTSSGRVRTDTPSEGQPKAEEPEVKIPAEAKTKKPAGPKIRWSQEQTDYLRDLSNQPLPWEEIYVLFRERYPTPPHPYRSDHAMQVKLNRWQTADRRASATAATSTTATALAPAGHAWTAVNGDVAAEGQNQSQGQGQGQGRGSLSAVKTGSIGGNGGSAPRYRTARNIKKVFDVEPEDASPAPAVERSTSDGSKEEVLRAAEVAGEETGSRC